MSFALAVTPMSSFAPEPDLLSRFVADHQASVFGVAYAVLLDRAAAEEVAQEAFLVAWLKLREGEKVEHLPAWLCGIARNLARNVSRRVRDRGELGEVASSEVSALDSLMAREESLLVTRALTSLPATIREPLVLFYVDGESVKGVSEKLALSEDVVRQRLSRGREQLRSEVSAIERRLPSLRPRAAFTAIVIAACSTRGSTALAAPAAASFTTKVVIGVVLAGTALVSGSALVIGTKDRATRELASPAPVVAAPAPALATVAASSSSSSSSPSRSDATRVVASSPASRTVPAQTTLTLPDALSRKLDLDLDQASAQAVLKQLAAASEVPIVVIGDLSDKVNVRANDVSVLETLDDILLQAGAERRTVVMEDGRVGLEIRKEEGPTR